jgi:hypothetical protein
MQSIQKPFDFIKEITVYKHLADSFSEEELKLFQPFMIHKFLSMNPELLDVVNYIQRLNIEDKRQLYTIYREFIPIDGKYYPFLKKSTTKKENELVIILKDYFEISYNEMKDALSLLDKHIVTDILIRFGYNDKEIKKLIKSI